MDGRESISIKVKQRVVQPTITAALAAAFHEWFLIFLLFIDACFSYLVTKFASCCQLQIPCLLCSRLDHVLGKEKAGFYWDLICKKHKLQISSLVHCKLHENLVDVHGICENCLFSFATVNKSNAETYRLLVGKLGDVPLVGLDDDPLIADNSLSALDGRKCSCCHQPWISRGQRCMLFRTGSYEATELDAPLLASNIHDRDEREGMRDLSSQKTLGSWKAKKSGDPLPHIEYEKVKMTSDTESEASNFDDDSATELFCVNDLGEKDIVADHHQKDLQVDNLGSEKLIDPSESLVIDSEQAEASDLQSSGLTPPIGHGLEEINWRHVEDKTCVAAPSELQSFSDMIPSSDVNQSSVHESKVDAVGVSGLEKAVTKSDDFTELTSNSTSTNEKQSDLKSGTSDAGLQMPSSLELGDAYKLAIGSRGRQLSGKFSEQKSIKDSARLSEDLKLLLSQLSAARGIELPLFDISPRVSGSVDELKACDTSSSVGMQILQKRISLERNESGISLDGSTVSEIEGESAIDRLKRQVEHDKKIMVALYKELEEERNASAVAANQAMAMITRLQEEKAALHMEALQCVRMMEEQEEYDVEALQKANELLAEKEKEIQDLEAELEVYRKTIGDLSPIGDLPESNYGLNIGGTRPKQTGTGSAEITVRLCDSNINVPDSCNETDELVKFTEDEGINVKSSQPEFEDEALLILQCLRKLEKKLQLFSSNGSYLDIADQDDLSSDTELLDDGKAAPEIGEAEVDGSVEHVSLHEASISVPKISAGQHEKSNQLQKGGDELMHPKHMPQNAELDALKNEFHGLSGRLEALEAEHSFLEHSINSLSRGDEGLKFIQTIASHVRELHSLGIKRKG